VGRVCVDEHVFADEEDGACQACSVLAKHSILQNDDHREKAIVDVVGVAVVDERDVEVVLIVDVKGGLDVGGVDADLLLLI
jgi:uncharacterized Zn ribbon protein